jgi:uncharacterized protein YutE (UPF0331/DUF86 family)
VLIHKYPTIDDTIVYATAVKDRAGFSKFKKEILSSLKKIK